MNIIQNYDVLLMDLWGVVHDGDKPYSGVIETLIKLKELKKDIIFFSNVPRRKHTVQKILGNLGIDNSLYSELIASGEFVHELLAEKKQFGTKYFYLGSPESEEVILSLDGYQRVANPKEADFAIITGIVNYYKKAMELAMEAIKYKLPLVCTNPDKSSIKENGEVMHCPGVVADKYEELGGTVIHFGKPYKHIYEYALQNVKDKKKVLAIGDSMANDIKGANNVELDSVLVCSGVHRHDLKIKMGDMPTTESLSALYKKYSIKPTFVVSLLKDIIYNAHT